MGVAGGETGEVRVVLEVADERVLVVGVHVCYYAGFGGDVGGGFEGGHGGRGCEVGLGELEKVEL